MSVQNLTVLAAHAPPFAHGAVALEHLREVRIAVRHERARGATGGGGDPHGRGRGRAHRVAQPVHARRALGGGHRHPRVPTGGSHGAVARAEVSDDLASRDHLEILVRRAFSGNSSLREKRAIFCRRAFALASHTRAPSRSVGGPPGAFVSRDDPRVKASAQSTRGRREPSAGALVPRRSIRVRNSGDRHVRRESFPRDCARDGHGTSAASRRREWRRTRSSSVTDVDATPKTANAASPRVPPAFRVVATSRGNHRSISGL